MVGFLFLLITRLTALADGSGCATSAPITRKQQGVITDLKDAIDMTNIAPLLGICAKGDPAGAVDEILDQHQKNFADLNKALFRRPGDAEYDQGLPKIKKQNGKTLTRNDIIAIDFLARTIFAEIGTREECNVYLPALGALILSRQDRLSEDPQKWQHRLARPSLKSTMIPLVDIVLSPGQFDVWNPKSPANLWARCPAKMTKMKYANNQSTGTSSHNQWEDAMRVAAEMVIFEDNFREFTKGFSAINYTSTAAEVEVRKAQGYRPVRALVGGHVLPNNARCMNFWDEGTSQTAQGQ